MDSQRRLIIVANLTLSLSIGLVTTENTSEEAIHKQFNGAHLIEYGDNFALSSPLLLQKTGWVSANLNNNYLFYLTPNCHYWFKDYDSLTQEQREALSEARHEFDAVVHRGTNHQQTNDKFTCLTRYSLTGQLRGSSSCTAGVRPSPVYYNGSSIVRYDEQNDNISVGRLRRDFPSNIVRLFIDKRFVSHLDRDGKITMKPMACLERSEVGLVERARDDARQLGELVAEHRRDSHLEEGPGVDSQSGVSDEIVHLQLNEAHLIGTEASRFALAGPALQQIGWKTYLLFFSDNCDHSVEHFDSLEPGEQAALLDAKELTDGQQQVYRSAWTRYSLSHPRQSSMSIANNISLVSFDDHSESFISKHDPNNLSMSRADLPNDMTRIFLVNGDVAGFVYRDGQVIMIPVRCLEPMGVELIERLKREASAAEKQFYSKKMYPFFLPV